MFSLCIPTMNRFDRFLSRYLVKYLENSAYIVAASLRTVLTISTADPARLTCLPKRALIGVINKFRNLSIYDFIQKLKLSCANLVLPLESDSGLKNIAAIITGKSHRLLSQLFITPVFSRPAMVSPKANNNPKVININGHFESISFYHLR